MAILRQLKAIEDLEEISDYIAERNQAAALRFLNAVEESFRLLERLPLAGRACRFRSPDLVGVRKRVVHGFRRYVIYYRPAEDGVEILRVLHGSRDTRALLGEDFD
jgi:toxin ParE1/3/4